MKQPHIFALSILLFALFPLVTYGQGACGDIVTLEEIEFGVFEEVREPIIDCDNPFGVTDEPTLSLTYTAEGAPLLPDDTLRLTSATDTITVQIDFGQPVFDTGTILFQLIDEDYRQITDLSPVSTEVQITATGTYALVNYVSIEPPILGGRPKFFEWLIPTAHAQGMIGAEVYAITFSVELLEPEATGASSVLFLPGIQASRLYKDGLFGEVQLWEPVGARDVRDLEMSQVGESINDIYTNDPIDEALGVIDIYVSFLNSLEELKSKGKIKEFTPFAYDWRYSVYDVATEPVLYPDDEEKRLLEEILGLAEDSYSGKVTIVAHSNGGLVAKALYAEYGKTALAGKIDKLIMVGTPETGAPKAIASLLHGYDQGSPANIIINDSIIRNISKNIPGVYGLLPSEVYLNNNPTPLIFFDPSDSTEIFRSEYGNAVNSLNELADFINGVEGRLAAEDISAASFGNSNLLAAAQFQAETLDALEFDSDIEIYSVLGTGKETEVAFEYREFTERVCVTEFLTEVCTTEEFYRPVPILSLAGDETVPSGSFITGSPHYIDIKNTNYEHKNLTESPEVQSFISNVLTATSSVNTNSEAPTYSSEMLLIGLHSPMEIVIIDEQGRESGLKNGEVILEVPNTTYRELAGARYVTISKDSSFIVELQGTGNGGATLTIDKFSDDKSSQVAVLPIEEVSTSTTAVIAYDNKFTNLEVDTDGDGIIDIEVGLDGILIEDDITYETLRSAILELDLNSKKKRVLLKSIARAERYNVKTSKRAGKFERRILRFLKFQLKWFFKEEQITKSELELLRELIQVLIKQSK